MAFVGQTVDPWDVPVKQAIDIMQKIWNSISSEPYEITDSTPVYKKVCDRLSYRIIFTIYNVFQTVQRLADSWRNIIGSTGLAVVLAFCDSQPDLKDSDDERVNFANYYLDNLRFLYEKFEGPKEVCNTLMSC
jgi:hypothetical protein